jgi:hypothetical protein
MPFHLRPPLEKIRAGLRGRPWDVLGCVVAMAYGIPTAWYPFGSDQGIHWYLGHRLLEGVMPYASGTSGKPPLIFLVHAFAEVLFGNHQSSIRILEILSMPLFGWLIATGVRRRGEPVRDGEVGCAALLLSAATYTYQDYWNTAHPETGMTMSLIAALAVAVHARPGRRRPLLVGALSMVAFLFKYPGAAMALPIAGYCGFRALFTDGWPSGEPYPRRPSKERWIAFAREAGWFLAGAAIVFVACLLPFILTNTVREMYEVCVLMTENYASGPSFPWDWYEPLFDPRRQGTFFNTMMVLFLIGVAFTIWRKRRVELAFGGFLFLLVLASIASVVMQKRLFTYHWLATYPFFVAIAVWGVRQVAIEPRIVRGASPFLLAIAAAFTVAAFFYQPHFITKTPRTYREHVASWWPVATGAAPRETLTMNYQRTAEADKFGDLVRASMTVRERARPGDALCLTCFISPLYQLTGLNCTTRHAIGSFTQMGPRYWGREYVDFFRDSPPRFVVSIHTYPKRNRMLRNVGYREIARYGTVIVFEHGGPPP